MTTIDLLQPQWYTICTFLTEIRLQSMRHDAGTPREPEFLRQSMGASRLAPHQCACNSSVRGYPLPATSAPTTRKEAPATKAALSRELMWAIRDLMGILIHAAAVQIAIHPLLWF